MKYPVVYEATPRGYSAYVPDLPGCVAAGDSVAQTRVLIVGAMEMHLAAMKKDGEPFPAPSSVELVEVVL